MFQSSTGRCEPSQTGPTKHGLQGVRACAVLLTNERHNLVVHVREEIGFSSHLPRRKRPNLVYGCPLAAYVHYVVTPENGVGAATPEHLSLPPASRTFWTRLGPIALSPTIDTKDRCPSTMAITTGGRSFARTCAPSPPT